MPSKTDLESKCQGHSRNQKIMTWGTKNMPPQKNLAEGSLSNWCDADADDDSSKTILRIIRIILSHSRSDRIFFFRIWQFSKLR